MQRGFTKLFNTIVTSTIWQEDDKTRIVWITMLAIADACGIVGASIPGLASVSNVSVNATRLAIKTLLAPDADSRTKDFDGRRIEEIDGGWRILNYLKYRRMLNEEERKEYKAKWIAEKRLQESTVDKRRQMSKRVTHAEAEADREEVQIYCAFPLKVGKPAALRAIKNALSKTPFDELLYKTKAFAMARNGDVAFCPNPSTWFNQERYNDDPETWKPKSNGQVKPKEKAPSYQKITPPRELTPAEEAEAERARKVAREETARFKEKFK